MPVNINGCRRFRMKVGEQTAYIDGRFGDVTARITQELFAMTGSPVVYVVCAKADGTKETRFVLCDVRGAEDAAQTVLPAVTTLSRAGYDTSVETRGKRIPFSVESVAEERDELSEGPDAESGPSSNVVTTLRTKF